MVVYESEKQEPLQVDRVYIENRPEPLENCIVWITRNFLIVTQDKNSQETTFYNMQDVHTLEGVHYVPQTICWIKGHTE